MGSSTTEGYEIVLKNCSFYGYHGVLPEEKRLGQRFYIDAILRVNSLDACETGNLSSGVDYGSAFALIEKLVTGPSQDLIESLALNIGKSLCSEFPNLVSTDITVRKPSAPIPGILDYVEVTVCHRR